MILSENLEKAFPLFVRFVCSVVTPSFQRRPRRFRSRFRGRKGGAQEIFDTLLNVLGQDGWDHFC